MLSERSGWLLMTNRKSYTPIGHWDQQPCDVQKCSSGVNLAKNSIFMLIWAAVSGGPKLLSEFNSFHSNRWWLYHSNHGLSSSIFSHYLPFPVLNTWNSDWALDYYHPVPWKLPAFSKNLLRAVVSVDPKMRKYSYLDPLFSPINIFHSWPFSIPIIFTAGNRWPHIVLP